MNRLFTRNEVFVDTAALLAMVDSRDELHRRAKQVEASLIGSLAHLVVSDAVLTEFLSLTSPRSLRSVGIAATESFMRSEYATVVPTGRKDFLAAFDLFRSRPDKEWSLVDCSSILICQERGIRRVFTSDRHFRQAGLHILLP